MKTANIADFKNHISYYIKTVAAGDVVRICNRNIAVADVIPVRSSKMNLTQLNCGRGSALIKGDLTAPVFEADACASISLS